MFTPSPEIIQLLESFATEFTAPALRKATDLICGVILSPGRRTIASALRAIGRGDDPGFGKYHRFLSRDEWSALHLSKFLLLLLLKVFIAPDATVDIVVDETLERRKGKKIAYRGWFRDAVRSTQQTTVTSPGVRWLSLCLLVPVPWSKRQWALPFCTVPVCSEKNCQKRGRLFRGTIGLTCGMMVRVRDWLPTRHIRLVGDGGFTAMDLMYYCTTMGIEHCGRFRLDAAIYNLPADPPKGKRGPKARKGTRLPSLKQQAEDPNTQWESHTVMLYGGEMKTIEIATGTALWHVSGHEPTLLRWVLTRVPGQKDEKKVAAFFSTNVDRAPERIVESYAQRWNIEVFFEEVRACLKFETQRGWCNRTIGRTTPCLFGIFSLVTILAKQLHPNGLPMQQTAWYTKDDATFSDILAAVRQHLWTYNFMSVRTENKLWSRTNEDLYVISKTVFDALQKAACYTV
jgi:hypothetical protein